MLKRGPIPPLVHGVLDYGLAALLIAAPFLFSFEDDAATAVSLVAGVLVLVIAASTAWKAGIIKMIPPATHGTLDYLLAILLIAAPFLFQFDGDGTALAFFLIVGVGGLLLAIATRFTPDDGRNPAVAGSRGSV